MKQKNWKQILAPAIDQMEGIDLSVLKRNKRFGSKGQREMRSHHIKSFEAAVRVLKDKK